MAYNDKKFGQVFPTRFGSPTGTSNERQMLDAIDGSDSFRKRYRTLSDGTKVRLETNNGMPRFFTEPKEPEDPEYNIYMESGQLAWTWPAEENPTRLYPATWHFMDIPTTSDYLGFITGKSPNPGAQKNIPALSEGQDSLAIGYPRKADPVKDTYSRDSYAAATLVKKVTAGYFPPSLFSGKMRLFLQAQYGAQEAMSGFALTANVIGENITLLYTGVTGQSITLGLWAHNSVGIFAASDGTWWLLMITGGPTFTFTAYKIKPNSVGEVLRKHYLLAGISDTYRVKLEAYILAHSTVDVASARVIGSAVGVSGSPLAYGWKWNNDGSRASIVLHETLGNGETDVRWKASTLHAYINYSAQAIPTAASFSVSAELIEHGEWTDGTSYCNIFVPDVDIETRLRCEFIPMANRKPPFNYSSIPIYGYFKNNEWTPVTLSRTVYSGTAQYAETHDNLVFNAADDPTTVGVWEKGFYPSSEEWRVYQEAITQFTVMTLAFDGATVIGQRRYGSFTEFGSTFGGPIDDGQGEFTWVPSQSGGAYCENQTGSKSQYDSMYYGYYATIPDGNGNFYIGPHAKQMICVRTHVNESWTGADESTWALVIPGHDAEAVYVATGTHMDYDSYVKKTTVFLPQASLHHWNAREIGPLGSGATNEVYLYVSTIGVDQTGLIASEITTTEPPESSWVTAVTCFNNVVANVPGTPMHSYYPLFSVDTSYPYYDPGMFVHTSAGARYVFSEGPKSPESASYSRRFVGWV